MTESNKSDWLRKNTLLQKELQASIPGAADTSSLNEALGIIPGDMVWMSRRKAVSEVSAAGIKERRK